MNLTFIKFCGTYLPFHLNFFAIQLDFGLVKANVLSVFPFLYCAAKQVRVTVDDCLFIYLFIYLFRFI